MEKIRIDLSKAKLGPVVDRRKDHAMRLFLDDKPDDVIEFVRNTEKARK